MSLSQEVKITLQLVFHTLSIVPPFAAEHYDDAGDFVARIIEVDDAGCRVKLAVSIFTLQAEHLQQYRDYGTTMEETGETDAEKHRIILLVPALFQLLRQLEL